MRSPHYTFQEVASGVFAAVEKEEGTASSNAGLVDLGDLTILFDTSMTPAAARDLRQAAVELTGRPPGVVINSHFHGDHTYGNQVFAGLSIVSTAQTRAAIDGRQRQTLEQSRTTLKPQYEEALERLSTLTDPDEIAEVNNMLALYRPLYAAIDEVDLTLPNVVFDIALDFEGASRPASLMSYGGGHTESDAFLYLPADGIIFIGDLVFNGYHPFIGHGSAQENIDHLARIQALGAQTIVPGHGPVGGAEIVQFMQDYLTQLINLVGRAKSAGATIDEVAEMAIPEEFASLVNLGNMFRNAVVTIYQSL